jgi:hypothetical protein
LVLLLWKFGAIYRPLGHLGEIGKSVMKSLLLQIHQSNRNAIAGFLLNTRLDVQGVCSIGAFGQLGSWTIGVKLLDSWALGLLSSLLPLLAILPLRLL